MYRFAVIYLAALLGPFFTLVAGQAQAVSHPYEFHSDAKIATLDQDPIDKAYGYMNVFTNPDGHGLINVMFSNASRVDEAEFNARVKFLDRDGEVIQEERFNCWIDSSGIEHPIECKVSKYVTLINFDSILMGL